MLPFPFRSTHHSSDCNETFTSCKHARNDFGNIKKLKILLTGVPSVALPGAHTIHPIKKTYYLEYPVLSYQEHKPFNRMR